MPEEVAVKLGGKVCTFGSFRLGVNSKGADIDTLCIAPRHIERVDFFSSFADLLRKQPETQKLMVTFPARLLSSFSLMLLLPVAFIIREIKMFFKLKRQPLFALFFCPL